MLGENSICLILVVPVHPSSLLTRSIHHAFCFPFDGYLIYVGRNEEAEPIYQKLAKHPTSAVAKKAKQVGEGERGREG